MFELIKDNVVKIVDSAEKRDRLIAGGFTLRGLSEKDFEAEADETEESECKPEQTATSPSRTPTDTSPDITPSEAPSEADGKPSARRTRKSSSD